MTGVGIVGSANAALAEGVAWDGEYDVVVVGMGFAGCVSAISAADEGAKVLLVDKAPEGSAGGNSRVSRQCTPICRPSWATFPTGTPMC